MSELKVYRITYDGEDRYVEAETFGQAVEVWSEYMVAQWKRDEDYEEGDEDRQPASVEHVGDYGVIRKGWRKETSGVALIRQERDRQIVKKGWSLENDREDRRGEELAWAAACYAAPSQILVTQPGPFPGFRDPWPFAGGDRRTWRNTSEEDRVKELTQAGALIAAEIDRLATDA